jgi:hypothetical protein
MFVFLRKYRLDWTIVESKLSLIDDERACQNEERNLRPWLSGACIHCKEYSRCLNA